MGTRLKRSLGRIWTRGHSLPVPAEIILPSFWSNHILSLPWCVFPLAPLLSESLAVACPHYSADVSVLSGGEACQLQQGRGSGNQGDYWRVHLPKERGAVSDCPVHSQSSPQGALLSFMPCLTHLHFIALALAVGLSSPRQSSSI